MDRCDLGKLFNGYCVSYCTVAPTQLLATQYFKQYSVGFIVGWLFLSHQIGSALGAYLPGLLYNETGNYNLSFYCSIIFLVGASILNILIPEPNEAKKIQKINLNQSHTTN
ncbi:hypothetical protein HMPREF0083_05860 [Aneurinibacillus aneurinilyticus ATCC 12856]|jgi:predicted MFS family arabinose efflux permease|uniref:Major facilitator superfamily (MFS) profile domain-containing protein n=1 Tax=Aneurinibacillus aneurinilyticus ATCC 12856 TaxID=649747 RepID=U1XY76_ANEAE|nr:hypothetical protein HMPREF0083_05860 [Aneurinibacillus aneurinilyticus ATCC 12856]